MLYHIQFLEQQKCWLWRAGEASYWSGNQSQAVPGAGCAGGSGLLPASFGLLQSTAIAGWGLFSHGVLMKLALISHCGLIFVICLSGPFKRVWGNLALPFAAARWDEGAPSSTVLGTAGCQLLRPQAPPVVPRLLLCTPLPSLVFTAGWRLGATSVPVTAAVVWGKQSG